VDGGKLCQQEVVVLLVTPLLCKFPFEGAPSINGGGGEGVVPCSCIPFKGLHEHFHNHILVLHLQTVHKLQESSQVIVKEDCIVSCKFWKMLSVFTYRHVMWLIRDLSKTQWSINCESEFNCTSCHCTSLR
jgi:hypothetical protein